VSKSKGAVLSERAKASESKDAVEGLSPPASTAQPTWSVYVLLCRNDSYYVGVTNDLSRRLDEHRTGRGGHYTRCNPPVRLVYREAFPSRNQADARERQLKGWTRRKKQALIAGDRSLLKKL
jgi:predicted GIY-YIG superfamily endonuclease